MLATDVFNEGYSFWNTALAVAIHLAPAAIVVVVLVLAWRWEWIGVVIFAAVGTLCMVTTSRHPSWILMISGPLFLIPLFSGQLAETRGTSPQAAPALTRISLRLGVSAVKQFSVTL